MKTTVDLAGAWSFRAGGETNVHLATASQNLPASVPGCVHTDLLALGMIEDPYLDLNELSVQWVSEMSWTYSRTFTVDAEADRITELVFEGIDTVSEVRMNDQLVGETFNMHRTYRWDVTELLRAGENRLSVTFPPVRDYGFTLRQELGDRPHNYPEPYNVVRKMASNFGWDWGPNLATVGIWKGVRLETWSAARLGDPAVSATFTNNVARLELDLPIARQSGDTTPLTVSVEVAGVRHSEVVTGDHYSLAIDVPAASRWWPRGMGEQALYPMRIELTDPSGTVLDEATKRIGFRDASLSTGRDSVGMSYTIGVNGVDLFIRGANWIPDDCFVSGVTRERYRARIQQAVDANINLLRVWGGGIYEKDEFYDICDELGVMVSQDFLFACAAYPEEEPVRSEVEAEALDNVRRLSGRPSLVLWNGSNENIWGYFDWGWQEKLGDSTWGLGYYTELLPSVVARLDPHTPYWASSPYSGSMDIHPNNLDFGNSHLWDVWNAIDYRHYADAVPRFVSEFGFQGPANWATIRESLTDEPLAIDSPGMLHHQKARDGNGKLARGMQPHLPEPSNFDDWHYLTQLNQAKAVAFGIEFFRSSRPVCMGAIVWQLNDCWPVTSWAAIDGAGRKKPLWYALRDAYADRLVTVQPGDGDAIRVVLVNDGTQEWVGDLLIRRVNSKGATLAEATSAVRVPANGSASVDVPPQVRGSADVNSEFLIAEIGTLRAFGFYVEDRDFRFEPAEFETTVTQGVGEIVLEITAKTLLRDLVLNVDRVDRSAVCDRQLVTLLPGETHRFTVSTQLGAKDPRWLGAPVIRCVNDMVAS